jgi:predicted amidohydrolase
VQNSIAAPTTDSIQNQRKKIYEKIERIIEAAAQDNVNILCLQEAWSEF